MSLLLEIGAFFLGQKLADITWNGNELIEANLALRKEQLTQAQMQTEMMRLQAEVEYMKRQKQWALLEQTKANYRKEFPDSDISDAEWEAEFRSMKLLT